MNDSDQFELILITATDLVVENNQFSMMLVAGMVERIGQTAADSIGLLHIRFNVNSTGGYFQRDPLPFHGHIFKRFHNKVIDLL